MWCGTRALPYSGETTQLCQAYQLQEGHRHAVLLIRLCKTALHKEKTNKKIQPPPFAEDMGMAKPSNHTWRYVGAWFAQRREFRTIWQPYWKSQVPSWSSCWNKKSKHNAHGVAGTHVPRGRIVRCNPHIITKKGVFAEDSNFSIIIHYMGITPPCTLY